MRERPRSSRACRALKAVNTGTTCELAFSHSVRSCHYFRHCPGTRTSQVLSGSQDRLKYAHARPGDATMLHSLLRVIEACIEASIVASTALHSLTTVVPAGAHLGLSSQHGAPLSYSFIPSKHIPSRFGRIRRREAHTEGHCVRGWPLGIADAPLLPWIMVGCDKCRSCSSPRLYSLGGRAYIRSCMARRARSAHL